MDLQLGELIEKIRSDGIKSAEEEAEKIITDAEQKASSIVRQAENDAERLREVSRAEADKAHRSGKEALRQAGRNLVLSVKGEIESLFDRVLTAEVARSLDENLLSEAVLQAVKQLARSEDGDAVIELSEKDAAALEGRLRAAMSDDMARGTDIKPFRGLNAGFRVSMKNGSVFYDFSEKEIAGMIARCLNPRLAELLTE